jgi:hypothetical protein
MSTLAWRGYDSWRRKWGQVTDLVDEITRMVRIAD